MVAYLTYRALVAEETGDTVRPAVKELNIADLPEGEVLIKVLYSSLNYKDALSAHGNKGITKKYPHTPGIDSSGVVVSSAVPEFNEGDNVVVCGYDLGMNTAGGFGQYIRVPADWVMPLPDGLTPEESMMLGTAGFTASLAIYKMELNGQLPGNGPVLVTGATGGLGSLAVNILSGLGYEVIASTGKTDETEYLQSLGASKIISREETDDQSGKTPDKPDGPVPLIP
jgi:acrylyl-CoA reductase (NADPH)